MIDDEVVSHAFSHGLRPDHTERLASYWAEALGGSPNYSATYGDETDVVRLHSGNGPHEEMDARAIACFDQALRYRTRRRRPGPDGASRLLRLGDDDHDVGIPPVRGRCARRPHHPALVVEWPKRRSRPPDSLRFKTGVRPPDLMAVPHKAIVDWTR